MINFMKDLLMGFTEAEKLRRELDVARLENTRMQNKLTVAEGALGRQTRWHDEATAERDAARDQVSDLSAENLTLRKTNTLFRSLIGILRDCNRQLDERNVYLEKLHGMTPGERLAEVENDAPNRCTKLGFPTERLKLWQGYGSDRWGFGVAIDFEHLALRVSELERKVLQ